MNKEEETMNLPIWKDEYDRMGVTPRELYMRQNGLCWLVPEIKGNKARLFCTDGKDVAPTDRMLNPTIECVRCIARFVEKSISHEIGKDEPQ